MKTYVAGAQPVLYPGAPKGFVVAGDPGIPSTIAPTSFKNFAPCVGLAYAPYFDSCFGRTIFGDAGKSSVRASYGIFYTAFLVWQQASCTPCRRSGIRPLRCCKYPSLHRTRVDNGQRFPFSFPLHSTSASHPDNSVDWANFTPISADPFFDHRNRASYIDNYMLSFERQLTRDTVFTASYVGNQGHRLLALVSANPGDPALCLALPSCGPFGEDNSYTNASGQTMQGTRVGQGPDYG